MAERFAAQCGTCPFYVAANEKTGYCHGEPPKPFLFPGNQIGIDGKPSMVVRGLWAPVDAQDIGCAKHPAWQIGAVPIDVRLAGEVEGRG